jgi:hypothetical protein
VPFRITKLKVAGPCSSFLVYCYQINIWDAAIFYNAHTICIPHSTPLFSNMPGTCISAADFWLCYFNPPAWQYGLLNVLFYSNLTSVSRRTACLECHVSCCDIDHLLLLSNTLLSHFVAQTRKSWPALTQPLPHDIKFTDTYFGEIPARSKAVASWLASCNYESWASTVEGRCLRLSHPWNGLSLVILSLICN